MRSETTRDRQRQALPQTNQTRRRRALTRRLVAFTILCDRVPVQRALERAPLALEAIRSRVARRSTEVEAPVAGKARRPNRFPIQQHVRAQREVLRQARRPGYGDDVVVGDRNQATNRRRAL